MLGLQHLNEILSRGPWQCTSALFFWTRGSPSALDLSDRGHKGQHGSKFGATRP